MYEARRKSDWEQTARICSMWAKPGTKPEDFMPDDLKPPLIQLDGKAAMRALESAFGGKSN